ncbi:MAG TPA: hypothetical protein VMU14_16475 [Acidimicrobiales bacterium]|nr:hypothetical protein [Acidimicrobiales bacterium]
MAATEDKDIPTLVNELWDLVVRYTKQETVEPLRDLKRYLAWGLAGTVLLCIGLPLLVLGALRALEEELGPTHLHAHLSWVPYAAVVIGDLIVVFLLYRAIMSEQRRTDRARADLRKRGG